MPLFATGSFARPSSPKSVTNARPLPLRSDPTRAACPVDRHATARGPVVVGEGAARSERTRVTEASSLFGAAGEFPVRGLGMGGAVDDESGSDVWERLAQAAEVVAVPAKDLFGHVRREGKGVAQSTVAPLRTVNQPASRPQALADCSMVSSQSSSSVRAPPTAAGRAAGVEARGAKAGRSRPPPLISLRASVLAALYRSVAAQEITWMNSTC